MAGVVVRTWNRVWKLALAAMIGFFAGLGVWGIGTTTAFEGDVPTTASGDLALQGENVALLAVMLLDVVLGVLAMVLVGFRRRAPLAIAIALCLISGLSACSIGAFLLAVTSLGTRRRIRELLAALGAVTLSVAVVEFVLRHWLPFPGQEDALFQSSVTGLLAVWISLVVSVALPGLLGWSIGARRELVESLRREAAAERAGRESAEARARSEERNRIAREFHDELGHRLSLIALHAGALEYRDDLDLARTQEAAGAIRRNAHEALHEVRSTLQILRSSGETSTTAGKAAAPEPQLRATGSAEEVEPSPDVAERLAELAAEVRRAGSPVEVVVEADLAQLPAGTGRHTYRVVQEALTNALRHAPRQPVRVSITGAPGDQVTVVVTNPTAVGARPHDGGAGVGLIGAAERVRLAGGDLSVSTGETFVVRAWLPWAA
ncbi:sensor histidine kinase [Bogoriella caseilytica]|nr:histidine kinase [Bogoriella caseilytica]